MFLMVSCGGSSSDNNSVSNFGKLGRECYPNKTCDSGLICDDESNTCIVKNSNNPINDSDTSSEQTNDNADTSSEQKDDQIDTMSESVNDSGDTNPNDADLGDSANENPNNLPECSPTSSTPCYDSTSHLTWSTKSDWPTPSSSCSGSFGGFSDWRLPTISELRTLIQNCSKTQMPGGSCGITHPDHLSYYNDWNDACDGCPYDKNHPGQYSKFGDSEFFWSSSIGSDLNHAWIVAFSFGAVGIWSGYYDNGYPIDDSFYVRCVR